MAMITIRLNDDEKEKLIRAAQEQGLSLSDYVRATLLGARTVRRKKSNCKELQLVAYELNKIGTNLNQIARRVNTTREIDIHALEQLARIEDMLVEIVRIIFSLKAESQEQEQVK